MKKSIYQPESNFYIVPLLCILLSGCGLFNSKRVVESGEVHYYSVNHDDSLRFMTIVDALNLSKFDDLLQVVEDEDFLDFLSLVFYPKNNIKRSSEGFFSIYDYYLLYGKSSSDFTIPESQILNTIYSIGKTIRQNNVRIYSYSICSNGHLFFRFVLSDNYNHFAPLLNIFTNKLKNAYISVDLSKIGNYTYTLTEVDNGHVKLTASDLLSDKILFSFMFHAEDSKEGTNVFLDSVLLTRQNAQDIFDKYLEATDINKCEP